MIRNNSAFVDLKRTELVSLKLENTIDYLPGKRLMKSQANSPARSNINSRSKLDINDFISLYSNIKEKIILKYIRSHTPSKQFKNQGALVSLKLQITRLTIIFIRQ